ncbi:hydroxyacid dehydrogenase [Litorilinea aerophila]|uniref:Hydroxyacid dehydrogenase n=1 Tax=Litorilinea aerophila TaxID=1204385 RepID=A0A540VGU3_9CHLR|nr:hydroxyacid dehydrogenase [Litorilinea aerophila]MCC9076372.1 hydroxyacid dehydrogenase [Litorilinea aerophila]
MPITDLTHLWVEVPPYSDALKLLPDHVAVLFPAEPPASPFANAGPAQAILASSGLRYDRAVFEQLPNLRIITRTGIGVDNINLDDATVCGIVVCNTPDGPTESTAEHTVAMLLNLAKRIKQGNDNLAAGKFGPRSGPLIGVEVQGKTLGLVGLGRIGRRVAQICRHGFDMRVLATDPFVTPEQAAALGVTLADLETVLAEADFLSLHVPATPETYRLINRERLARMKDGAFLLNLARGPLVDPDALLEALESGKLAGAGLDVFDPEPPPVDSPLRNHPLIVATPHSASLTVEGRTRIETMAVERVIAFFRDGRAPDVVNPAVLESPTLRS